MSSPEVEVRTFKQQGGESFKDAWYRISDAHHRCTKKHSTTILLRNFYVGISSWNRYVLDTLTGGNFLGTPALEASYIIESLVGIPPVNEAKIEISLDDVIKKLEAIEKNLPSVETKLGILLENFDKLDKSLGGINERVAVLETCAIHDNQTHRIGELEEAMGTLGSTFSSLKFKEKAYVGKEQKFMYVPKVPKPKNHYELKIDKTLSTTMGNIDKGASKIPFATSCVFEENYDVDASSLDVT
jgi:hypothetical protein